MKRCRDRLRVQLLSSFIFSHYHNLSVFNSCIVLWLGYALLNRRESRVPILIPQRWDEALLDVQPHGNSESLIPMFEHMVDRAFSKTQGA